LELSEAKRLRALEDENGRLKRMLADAVLDNAALRYTTASRRTAGLTTVFPAGHGPS
jgi:putative transposase